MMRSARSHLPHGVKMENYFRDFRRSQRRQGRGLITLTTLTTFMFFLLGTFTAGLCADYSPPTNGLVGWWRGNGDATDSSGHGFDGTLEGMGFTSGVYGPAFAAGSRVRVYIPDDPAFALNSLTLGAFANANSAGYNIVGRYDNRPGADPYTIGMDVNNGRFAFQIQDLDNNAATLESPSPMALGQWMHYAATLDGDLHEMRIYINGRLVAATVTTVTPGLALNPGLVPGLGIGNVQDTFDFPFESSFDSFDDSADGGVSLGSDSF